MPIYLSLERHKYFLSIKVGLRYSPIFAVKLSFCHVFSSLKHFHFFSSMSFFLFQIDFKIFSPFKIGLKSSAVVSHQFLFNIFCKIFTGCDVTDQTFTGSGCWCHVQVSIQGYVGVNMFNPKKERNLLLW